MGRILLAEDDATIRRFLARALERAGHDVTAVGDGAQALPHLKPARFDLLIADIVMPELDGIELARRAIGLDRGLKVIFITGFAGVAKSSAPGATVLSKPFHLRDIVAEVNRQLTPVPASTAD
ncbi:response regulator [Desertibaculum subflavum]|uniref:response regulator n=1 Tax=Desertibaculum subflavum TaxID=2268458 RepID=UPI000E66CC57